MGNAPLRCSIGTGAAKTLLAGAAARCEASPSPASSPGGDTGDTRPGCPECTAKASRIFCGGEHTLLRDPATLQLYQLGACGLGFDFDCADTLADPRSYVRHVPVQGPVLSVFPGRYHNLLKLPGGRCYAYGCGRQAPNDGQLMNGSTDEAVWPFLVRAASPPGGASGRGAGRPAAPGGAEDQSPLRFASAALGGHHTLVRSRAGEVIASGAGWQGQMGDGTLTYKNTQPLRLEFGDVRGVAKIAAGYYHSAALTEDGRCYVWGCNEQDQLGRTEAAQVLRPRLLSDLVPELEGLPPVRDFKGGYAHTVLLLEGGRVFTLGNHSNGQRAIHPSMDDSVVPAITEVKLPLDDVAGSAMAAGATAMEGAAVPAGGPGPAQAVAAGNHHTLILAGGEVWAFGSDEFGQVTGGSSCRTCTGEPSGACAASEGGADEDTEGIVWKPQKVRGFPQADEDPVVLIDAGMYHSAAQTRSGRVFVWGCGSNGQTGDRSLADTTPLKELLLGEVARMCGAE